MFLPNGINGFGFFLDAVAVAFLIAALVTQIWGLLIGFLISGLLGVAAYLCWKNQTIKIIDEDTFVYSTFLGKKTTYKFSDIQDLKVNPDSLTLFVGDGKVHIESMVIVSRELMDKIDAALEAGQQSSAHKLTELFGIAEDWEDPEEDE